MGVRKKRELGAKKGSLRSGGAAPHLQPPVHHAVGADVHADGLIVLQLQRVLGVESEEVDQLPSGIDFCLDDCFTLPGEVASNKSTKGRVLGGMQQCEVQHGAWGCGGPCFASCEPPSRHGSLAPSGDKRSLCLCQGTSRPPLQSLPFPVFQGKTLIIAAHFCSY